jgi:hypothetical protein
VPVRCVPPGRAAFADFWHASNWRVGVAWR